jgi:hypothetical protein
MRPAVVLLVCVAAAAGVAARSHMVYAGFDHVLAFDSSDMTATAFDYRRHLRNSLQCGMFVQPPLLTGVKLEDWLSSGALASGSHENLTFTHMGYEVFLVEDKVTGSYLTRRCRDFRPQLEALPCEPLGTGQSDLLKAPFKTIFLGNSRAMILNTETGYFSIYPFDVDVHTGGDPFRFSSGPILSDFFPFRDGLADCEFAYIQLKNHGGDVLLVKRPEGVLQGWRFHGLAMNVEDWYFKFVFVVKAPQGHAMAMLGENQVLFYQDNYDFRMWDITQGANATLIVGEDAMKGNAFHAFADCNMDNVTRCTTTEGCAWCPITEKCLDYDRILGRFCDESVCPTPPMTAEHLTTHRFEMPDCVKDVPVEENHAEIIDTIDEGYDELEKMIRLGPDYRNGMGEHANAEASPIHPAIDSELGHPFGAYQDGVINEKNSVGRGVVYTPPASEIEPCMNDKYDATKGVEVAAPTAADAKMNMVPSDEAPPTFTLSPAGDAANATEHTNCTRNKAITPDLKTEFVPLSGSASSTQEGYAPAPTSTRHEEDLMNSDKTEYSDLKGHMGVDPMSEVADDRSPNRVGEVEAFKPKDTSKPYITKDFAPSLQPNPDERVFESHPDVMNAGIGSGGLVSGDQPVNGGNDGIASAQFSSAMNSAKAATPDMLESQQTMSKAEPKASVDNSMFPAQSKPQPEEQLSEHLPEAPAQHDVVDAKDQVTVMSGVSTDEEGDRVNEVRP